MSTYWVYTASDGRRYCWNKEPTFSCPLVDPLADRPDPDGDPVSPFGRGIDEAAAALSVAPADLAGVLRRAHRSTSGKGTRRRRVGGRLTDLCDVCGRRMKRLGFRAWIEVPDTSERTGTQITRMMFGAAYWPVRDSSRYFDTKKEAQSWALDEKRLHDAILADQ
jgi:hypothetical protein